MNIYIYIRMYVCIYTYIYIYYICMCIYIYVREHQDQAGMNLANLLWLLAMPQVLLETCPNPVLSHFPAM